MVINCLTRFLRDFTLFRDTQLKCMYVCMHVSLVKSRNSVRSGKCLLIKYSPQTTRVHRLFSIFQYIAHIPSEYVQMRVTNKYDTN